MVIVMMMVVVILMIDDSSSTRRNSMMQALSRSSYTSENSSMARHDVNKSRPASRCLSGCRSSI